MDSKAHERLLRRICYYINYGALALIMFLVGLGLGGLIMLGIVKAQQALLDLTTEAALLSIVASVTLAKIPLASLLFPLDGTLLLFVCMPRH